MLLKLRMIMRMVSILFVSEVITFVIISCRILDCFAGFHITYFDGLIIMS